MPKPPCVLRATTQLGTFPVLVFVVPSVSPVPAQGPPWLCEPEAPILIPVPVPQWNSRNLALAPPQWGTLGVSQCWQLALNFGFSVTSPLCQTQLKFSSSGVSGEDGQTTAEQKTVPGFI